MNIETKKTGSSLSSSEFNQIPDELENIITNAGIEKSAINLTQISQSISQMVGDADFYSTSGTANDIVLSPVSPRLAPANLTNGLRVRFKAIYDNTSVVTVNVANFGAKNITVNGEPIINEALKQGNIYTLTYMSSSDSFELLEVGSKSGGSGLELCDIGMALYVDETKGLRRYLNGQIVDINTNTQAFLNRLKQITTLHPSLLCTEDEWQTAKTMSAFGQVGKFVFNYSGDEVVSVRIPRVVNVQGLFDLQNLGMTVGAGLPNIIGTIGSRDSEASVTSGAFKMTSSYGSGTYGYSGTATIKTEFNASYSNPIYGNSNTVQQEAIQYPYFIQIATGSETENNIVNEIELNNPYSLFDSKYSDHELNNLSWLKSEGQWNAKSVYSTAYDKLLKVYNGTETVEGLSVKLSTETYTDYDFVLNTADETFRLPLDTIDHPINSTCTLPVVGNGLTLGLTNGTSTASLVANSENAGINSTVFNTVPNTTAKSANVSGSFGVVADASKSGLVANLTATKANLYLYFYVGETVQNANLIDAGKIGEIKANKTDVDGQWEIVKGKNLAYNVSFPINTSEGTIYIYDISDFLPNDGFDYEIQLSLECNGSAFVNGYYFYPDTDNAVSFVKGGDPCGGVILGLVNSSRTLKISIASTQAGVFWLNIKAYRRIGKNV